MHSPLRAHLVKSIRNLRSRSWERQLFPRQQRCKNNSQRVPLHYLNRLRRHQGPHPRPRLNRRLQARLQNRVQRASRLLHRQRPGRQRPARQRLALQPRWPLRRHRQLDLQRPRHQLSPSNQVRRLRLQRQQSQNRNRLFLRQQSRLFPALPSRPLPCLRSPILTSSQLAGL